MLIIGRRIKKPLTIAIVKTDRAAQQLTEHKEVYVLTHKYLLSFSVHFILSCFITSECVPPYIRNDYHTSIGIEHCIYKLAEHTYSLTNPAA